MQFGCYLIWTPRGTGDYFIYQIRVEFTRVSCWSCSLVIFCHLLRYKPGQVFLEKDLILPYVPNVDLCDAKCMADTESTRTTILFFRGRLKRNAVRILIHEQMSRKYFPLNPRFSYLWLCLFFLFPIWHSRSCCFPFREGKYVQNSLRN